MINLSSWRNDFESGHKDKYVVQAMDVGEVVIISLHIDECFGISNPDWFVDKILVTSSTQEKAFLFPCYRWIQSDMIVCQGKGTLAYQLKPSVSVSALMPDDFTRQWGTPRTLKYLQA